MKALILAGGFGTRLNDLGKSTAKGLIKINNKAIIDYILESLNNVKSVKEVIVVTNNKFYNDLRGWKGNKKITLLDNGVDKAENKLGAIGDMYFAIKKLNIDDDLLILGSDNLFDFQLNGLVSEFYKKRFSYLVVREEKLERMHLYGNALINSNLKLIDFVEKPEKPLSNLAASCIYLYPREILPLFDFYIKSESNHDQPGRFVSWLLKQKKDVYVYKITGRWFDIGHLETLNEAIKSFQ